MGVIIKLHEDLVVPGPRISRSEVNPKVLTSEKDILQDMGQVIQVFPGQVEDIALAPHWCRGHS